MARLIRVSRFAKHRQFDDLDEFLLASLSSGTHIDLGHFTRRFYVGIQACLFTTLTPLPSRSCGPTATQLRDYGLARPPMFISTAPKRHHFSPTDFGKRLHGPEWSRKTILIHIHKYRLYPIASLQSLAPKRPACIVGAFISRA